MTDCGEKFDHLLAQVDERPDAVDERRDDRQARLEGPAVAAEALDDAGAGLRDHSDGSCGRDEHEQQYDGEDDQSSHVAVPFSVRDFRSK